MIVTITANTASEHADNRSAPLRVFAILASLTPVLNYITQTAGR